MSEQIAFSYQGLIKAIDEVIEENGLDKNALVFGMYLPSGERVAVDAIELVKTNEGTPAIIFGCLENPNDGEKEDVPLLRVA